MHVRPISNQLALSMIEVEVLGRIHKVWCNFAVFLCRLFTKFRFCLEANITHFAKLILEIAICTIIRLQKARKRAATCQKKERWYIYTYTGISQGSHSKAESILNLYKKSTKYKISKICDGALSENRQRDRKRFL